MTAPNNTTKAGANETPRPRPGVAPTKPEAEPHVPKFGEQAPGDSQADKTEMAAADGNEYVKKADLEEFAARILNGFEDRMAKRRMAEARDRPAMRSGSYDALNDAPDRVFDIPVDGQIEGIDRPDLVEVHSDVEDIAAAAADGRAQWEADMKFMHEMVCVNVAESTNPNDQPVFSLYHNGKEIHITRGENIWMRRYYVEVLARSKPASYDIKVVKNQDGDVVNRALRSSALAYPFSIVQDRNPRGRTWLRDLLKQG